jgi:hypothetical protein
VGVIGGDGKRLAISGVGDVERDVAVKGGGIRPVLLSRVTFSTVITEFKSACDVDGEEIDAIGGVKPESPRVTLFDHQRPPNSAWVLPRTVIRRYRLCCP